DGTVSSLSQGTKDNILDELMEMSKALGETIRASTERKIHVDNFIKSMTQGAKERRVEEVGNEEAEED
ncbi:hypothetical protein A2U01_0106917, partial [Trifolium medium]|nr:hypothetical protein [Trifolium medium]